MNTVKIGVLCIPQKAFKSIVHNKKLFEDTNGKEVKYVVNTFQVGSKVATIQVSDEYFTVPLKWVKNHLEDMQKAISKNHIFTHKKGFKIINTGMGIGVKTDNTAKSWTCSMMGLENFLEYTKTKPEDYTKEPKKSTKKETK